MTSQIVPPKLYMPSRFKDILNKTDKITSLGLDYDSIKTNGIFKSAEYNYGLRYTSDDNEFFLLYRLLEKYYFSEIGYDTDEEFIQRFVTKWNSLISSAIIPLKVLNIFAKIPLDGIFNRKYKKSINWDKTADGTDSNTKTLDTNHSVDGTDTSKGDTTEYVSVTRNVDGTTTHHETGTNGGTIKDEGTNHDTTHHDGTENYEETYYDTEKLKLISEADNIANEFITKFETLFMEVYTYL